MAQYVMVVQSAAHPGREAAFAAWYDNHHIPDICSLPSVKSGTRYEAAMVAMGEPGLPNLAIYEVEADDPMQVMAEMGELVQSGGMSQSDTFDAASARMWFYKKP